MNWINAVYLVGGILYGAGVATAVCGYLDAKRAHKRLLAVAAEISEMGK